MKLSARLSRFGRVDNSGIFGEWFFDEGKGYKRFSFTKERLWIYNQKNISCIPDGTYPCAIIPHDDWGHCIWIQNVPGRSEILTHWGSWLRDLRGCITNGDALELTDNPDDEIMLRSTEVTHKKMMKYLIDGNVKNFMLEIVSPWNFTL